MTFFSNYIIYLYLQVAISLLKFTDLFSATKANRIALEFCRITRSKNIILKKPCCRTSSQNLRKDFSTIIAHSFPSHCNFPMGRDRTEFQVKRQGLFTSDYYHKSFKIKRFIPLKYHLMIRAIAIASCMQTCLRYQTHRFSKNCSFQFDKIDLLE